MTRRQLSKKLAIAAAIIGLFPTCGFTYVEHHSYPAFLHNITSSSYWHPVVTFSGGVAVFIKDNKSNFFPAVDPLEDSYYNYQANNDTSTAGVFGVFVGTQFPIRPNMDVQVGINYSQPFQSFNESGTVTQGPVLLTGAPDIAASDTFNYNYSVTPHQILAQAKFIYNLRQIIHPYFLVGLGGSYNRVKHFQVSMPAGTGLTNHFQNGSEGAFTYALGVGVDFDVQTNWRLGFGYRFTDYGKAQTGTSIIDTAGTNANGLFNPAVVSNNRLSINHIYSNEFTGQISYLLG